MPPPLLTLSHPTTIRVACPVSHSAPTDTYTDTANRPCTHTHARERTQRAPTHTYTRARAHVYATLCVHLQVVAAVGGAFGRTKTRRIVVRKRERGGGGRGWRAGGVGGGIESERERERVTRGEGSIVRVGDARTRRCVGGHACGGKRDPSEERTREETKEREVTSPQGLSRRLSATTRGVTPSSSSSPTLSFSPASLSDPPAPPSPLSLSPVAAQPFDRSFSCAPRARAHLASGFGEPKISPRERGNRVSQKQPGDCGIRERFPREILERERESEGRSAATFVRSSGSGEGRFQR